VTVDLSNTHFLFIIGAAKCGTTSLFRYLRDHPAICPSEPKEPNFFSNYFDRGLDWYRSIWDFDPALHRVAMEASTCYTRRFGRPDITERIRKNIGHVRFVYMIREPYARIESEYNFGIQMKYIRPGAPMVIDEYLYETMYFYQLEQFRKIFGRESILLLTMNELKRDPEDVIARVCRHVGLDAGFELSKPAGHVHNKTMLPPVYARFMDRGWVRGVKSLMPRAMRDRLRPWVYEVREKKRSLSRQDKALIRERLWEDSQQLQQQYGVDVSGWYG
jgi:hypothetical protein